MIIPGPSDHNQDIPRPSKTMGPCHWRSIQAPRAEQQAASQLVVRQATIALPWDGVKGVIASTGWVDPLVP